MDRGDLNANKDTVTTLAFAQAWNLQALGNWSGFDEDADGNGTDDLVQTRAHNLVNEITAISETAGPSWADPAHDDNGNMTTLPIPGDETNTYTATYDAWNRLVKLVDTSTSQTVAEYAYDGMGRRIIRELYVVGTLDSTHHDYWSAAWQLLEERIDGTSSSDVDEQYVWTVGYVDELICRDRDTDGDGSVEERLYALQSTNFNVTATVDATGSVIERYHYSPYGERTILDPNFAADADGESDVAWRVGHHGLLHDATGLIYNRSRIRTHGLGMWLQREILGYIDGMHLYQYTKSNPNYWLDPSGDNSLAHPENAILAGEIFLELGVGAGSTIVLVEGVRMTLHEVARLNETLGPTCKDTVQKHLQDLVIRLKKQVRKCTKSMCCDELKRLALTWSALKAVRTAINNKCWRGGDATHRDQATNAGTHAGKCWAFYNGKGCGK